MSASPSYMAMTGRAGYIWPDSESCRRPYWLLWQVFRSPEEGIDVALALLPEPVG